ncbi:Histone acetyltransferase [Aphelenchoides fujianensis]|nr:Histone acetyltransferase [Aphelenchoides fujianensis]
MGNEQSKRAKGQSTSSSTTTSRSTKNPLAALKPGPSSSKIQSHLANATKSRVLQLRDCNIKTLPDAIDQLEHLDLSNNLITSLPDDIAHLTAMELNLNRNRLSALNDHLADCKLLRVLRVEENCLEKRAFTKKILAQSSISLITYSGNLFQDNEFQDLQGYEETIHGDQAKRSSRCRPLCATERSAVQRALHRRNPRSGSRKVAIKVEPKDEEWTADKEEPCVPELTADVPPKPKETPTSRPKEREAKTEVPKARSPRIQFAVPPKKSPKSAPPSKKPFVRKLPRPIKKAKKPATSKTPPADAEVQPNGTPVEQTGGRELEWFRGPGRPRKSEVAPVPQLQIVDPSLRRSSNFARRHSLTGSRNEKGMKSKLRVSEAEVPARNQADFHTCAVCKEQTLLPTPEYEEELKKEKEGGQEEWTLEEDPSLFCVDCEKCFHLTCVYDDLQLQQWATANPDKFKCQECIRCARCHAGIYDPGQRSMHHLRQGVPRGPCKPETKRTYEFPAVARRWHCNQCEVDLKNVLDQTAAPSTSRQSLPIARPKTAAAKLPLKKKTAEKAVEEKPKVDNFKHPRQKRDPVTGQFLRYPPGHSVQTAQEEPGEPSAAAVQVGPEFSATQTEVRSGKPSGRTCRDPASPRATRGSPLKSEEEGEAQRLAFLSKLKESLRYTGEYLCIGAQESSFSHLNEETTTNERENSAESELHHFAPFAAVGRPKEEPPRSDCLFFFGNTAYRPRFFEFLRSCFASYQRLSFCPRCLLAHESLRALKEHMEACSVKHPPGGTPIYQEDNLTVWEVFTAAASRCSPKRSSARRTVFHEVEQFTFYVLTETDGEFCTLAGYFSKEIRPSANNNLSCLLILPWMQRKGYGLFLIDMSYQLSIRERKIGGPEHPLSDAGLKTYRQYWFAVLMSYVREKLYNKEQLDIVDIKEHTGIELRDITETLIIADLTFILDDHLHINVETPLYTKLSALRRRYVKTRLLKLNTQPLIGSPFTSYID